MLAIGVFAIFSVGIAYLSLDTLDKNGKVVLNNEALQYAQEGLEATRNIRDKNYLSLTNGDHGLNFAAGSWSFGLAPERVDGFYDRYITVSDVYRDVDGNIASGGTVFDPDTKRVDSEITWLQNGIIPRSLSMTEYLSNWKGDDWIRTTCPEFGEESGQETQEPTTPSITVCSMLLDYQGNVITGEDLAGTEFKIKLKDSDNHDVSESVFHTPLIYTKRVLAASPNYDTQCIVYDNLNEENYNYDQEVITNNGSSFKTPLYNDQFNVQIMSLSDFYQYNTHGNENANGSIDLGLSEKNRTLVVLNQYNSEIGDENPISGGGVYDNTEKINMDSPPDNNCGVKLAEIETGSSFFASADIGKHGEDVDKDGNYAYMATDDMNSGLNIINVSNPSSPTFVKSLNLGRKGISVKKDGNYVYVGFDRNTGLSIVDVTNPASASIKSTLSLGAGANQADIKGNYLFTAINQVSNAFKVYNVTSKTSPVLSKTINIGDALHTVKILGNYAYLGSYADNAGFKIYDITTPSNPVLKSTLNVGEEVHAIAFSGNLAFLSTANSKLKVVDISDPVHPALITTVATNGIIQDLTVSGDYLYAAIDSVHAGLSAFNISNPYSPYFIYSLDVGGKGTGIDSDDSNLFITTDTANKGLVIVGTTVTGTNTSGTYTSGILNTGSSSPIYNFIEWSHDEVVGGTLKFQLRTASSSGGIASATFVGPDGTGSSYYTVSRTPIVLSQNSTGSRYFQYRAYFESDGSNSPVLKSIRVNYTP